MESWKVCRALNNRFRLELVRAVIRAPERELTVVMAGEYVGLKKSAASQYLKQLTEAEILGVTRTGRFVICSGTPQENSTLFKLQHALMKHYDATVSEEKTSRLLLKLNALAHHGRAKIVRVFATGERLTCSEVFRRVDMPFATVARQLEHLVQAEVLILETDESGQQFYSLAPQHEPVASLLLELTLE